MARRFDFERLRSAIDWSVRQLAEPRKSRVDAIRQFVGVHYAQGGSERRVPVNMIEMAVSIYVRHLAARAPRVMVSANSDELKPFARNMELALNQIPEEIGLESTLRRAVLEAIFGIGVVKVGIGAGGPVYAGNDVGEAFVCNVSPDDYFLDMSAKSREGIAFEGNDYWLPLDDARELGDGQDLEPDEHTVHGDQGESRAEGVSTNMGADVYQDQVWLRDVWLPGTQEVVTYGVKSHKILRKVAWDGPECGPYHVLAFNDVPGNLMPLPPVSLLIDLHELGNELFRKLGRQAVAKKTVAAFAGGNDADVEALKKTADGEGLKYSGQKPEQITVGGIDAPTLAFFLQVSDRFSYYAGNLDSLGGLGPSSETASQDSLIAEASGARMASMKGTTLTFAKGVWKSLAWYEWTDPVRVRTIRKPVEGSDIVLKRAWSAETRDGDFLDFNLDVDPYSMADDSPAMRLQKIRQVLTEVIFPAAPMLQAQGGSIDFRELVALLARLGNLDELRSLVKFGEPILGEQAQAKGQGMPSFKPAQTKRTYERINRPGATRAGKDDVMGRLLMGGGVQGSEAASLTRGTT